jgi:hypothetical protein
LLASADDRLGTNAGHSSTVADAFEHGALFCDPGPGPSYRSTSHGDASVESARRVALIAANLSTYVPECRWLISSSRQRMAALRRLRDRAGFRHKKLAVTDPRLSFTPRGA